MNSRSSYSDDYLRRKAFMKADQPALLTDRNAYVNFLEVQLERVSAACLSVQAYDQKFTDMQAMIVGLEQRCSSTTRLVSLSQQCIEELRANVFTEIEKVAQRSTAQHVEIQRSIQILNGKLNTVEEGIHNLSNMPIRITTAERELTRMALAIQMIEDSTKKSTSELQLRVDPIQASLADALQSITSLQSNLSRQGLDLSELERRQSNSLMTLESKTADLMLMDRDENARKLQNLCTKFNYDIENLAKDIQSRELKVLQSFNSDLKMAQEEMARIHSTLDSSISANATLASRNLNLALEGLKDTFNTKCSELSDSIKQVTLNQSKHEADYSKQLLEFSNGLKSLDAVQSETTNALDYLKSSLSTSSAVRTITEEEQVNNEIKRIMENLHGKAPSRVSTFSGNASEKVTSTNNSAPIVYSPPEVSNIVNNTISTKASIANNLQAAANIPALDQFRSVIETVSKCSVHGINNCSLCLIRNSVQCSAPDNSTPTLTVSDRKECDAESISNVSTPKQVHSTVIPKRDYALLFQKFMESVEGTEVDLPSQPVVEKDEPVPITSNNNSNSNVRLYKVSSKTPISSDPLDAFLEIPNIDGEDSTAEYENLLVQRHPAIHRAATVSTCYPLLKQNPPWIPAQVSFIKATVLS